MNVEHRTLNVQRRIKYSVNLIKDSVSLLQRNGYEGRQRIYTSNLDSAMSFDPEFFNYELTTEGLDKGCGSLVIKSIKRSVINIRRSMLGVRCSTFKAFRQPGGVTAIVWRNLI